MATAEGAERLSPEEFPVRAQFAAETSPMNVTREW